MLEPFEFVFWEALKAIALIVLALLAAKAVKSYVGRRLGVRGLLLYAAIMVLVGLAAQTLGADVAAEVYGWTTQRSLDRHQYALASSNGTRAVGLRPGVQRYWQLLSRAKFASRQFGSLLQDEPAVRVLSPQGPDDDDLLRFAYCHYFLGQYGDAIAISSEFIRRNPGYSKAYLLNGQAELGLRRYQEAERDLLRSLQILPTQADAVETLAQAYFLSGDTAAAAEVLDATSHYSFSSQERARFEGLKALYAP